MHGLGPPRVPVKSTPCTTSVSKYTTTWEKPRASGTLESIVNQATRLPPPPPPHRKPFDGAADATADDLVPWFDHHHRAGAADADADASTTRTMDALVPCSNRTSDVDQGQGLGTCVVGCSTRVGSCSGTNGKDVDVILAGKRASEARVPAGEWSSRDQSVTGSPTCGMDSQHVTLDTCEMELGLGITSTTSLGSPEHTSSAGKPCTKAATTTTADDHDSVCHSPPQASNLFYSFLYYFISKTWFIFSLIYYYYLFIFFVVYNL